MSLPNWTRVLRNRFILPRVLPLLVVPCRCESKSESDRAADGGKGGLRLPEMCSRVSLLLITKVSETKNLAKLADTLVKTFSFTASSFFLSFCGGRAEFPSEFDGP
jgi:hypothetical protein